jgi:hypothetical protein
LRLRAERIEARGKMVLQCCGLAVLRLKEEGRGWRLEAKGKAEAKAKAKGQ